MIPYTRETLRLSHGKDSYALAKFTIPSFASERIYLTIHQISQNFIENQNYNVSRARIVIGKIISQFNLEYMKSIVGKEEDITIEMKDIEPGSYIAFIQIDWVEGSQV